MDQKTPKQVEDGAFPSREFSPYRVFSAAEWSRFRADTPMTLSEDEVVRLRSLGDPVSLEEVRRIYLSLSRLLSAHVESTQQLFRLRQQFLNVDGSKTPFIIGIAGSVAVGKSTTARVLKELLRRWPSSPKVDLITTDGFLRPNADLKAGRMMEKKGFPESYDIGAILRFLSDIKAGKGKVEAPVYSHFHYDVVPDKYVTIDRPDILIFEGINVLQASELPAKGDTVPFVSDFFDFSIYIDADNDAVERWYIERFMQLRNTAFADPESYFNNYSQLSEQQALSVAGNLWRGINLVNLRDNILPTRPRADLILRKGESHFIEQVALRKL